MIITGLSALFIINLFSLMRLYNAITEETVKIALLCIEESDIEEIEFRLKEISGRSDDEQHISIFKAFTFDVEASEEEEDKSEKSSQILDVFGQLMKEVRLVAHQYIDSILPVNMQVLDSLIASNFKNKGISAGVFYSELVDLNTGKVLASSRPATMQTKTAFYQYEFDTENKFAFQVYTTSMTGSVLKRMSGMLVSTLLTIALLGYAFGYFIRVVIRQKTLEEMKRDFTNNMTHELNTPISVAYSAIDTLIHFRQGESREKRAKYLNICLEQLTRLRDMVEHILSMSMDKNTTIDLNRSNIELMPLFDRIAGQQKLKAAKNVEITWRVQPENLTVFADETHLDNIINNLLDNAIKYAADNVKIEVRSYTAGDRCIISIKDDGVGISKENQKHIFDKFYRSPQGNRHNVKGFGLGLFYVKTMIERHNGEITVKSALNKGAEFIIKLPIG